jgi:sulfatase maturation enzyme AslB (radical SAM superfamily)
MTVEELSSYLQDPIFKEVTSVGINGGEPSLIRNLPAYAEEICKLPSLSNLNIISHGFNEQRLTSALKEIYKICKRYNKKFHVSISLDGFDEIHNSVRGVEGKGVFRKTFPTILEIRNNQAVYCDNFDIGCTIVKQNVDYLIELDTFLKINGLDDKIKYRLGIDNKRIESDQIRDQYSVIFDKLHNNYSSVHQSAKEFLMSRISTATTINDKFKYFSLFYWLNSPKPKRLLGCSWQEEGITMDARGKLFYCAVASKEIGDLRAGTTGEEIFFNKKNIDYRKSILKNDCSNCIHDYSGKTHFKNMLIFIKYMLNKRSAMYIYKAKKMFL